MHEALNASAFRSREGRQWRRYTRARQVKWPGWKIHRPGSSPGSALPSPAYCCLIALFVLFSRWNGVGGLCFDGDNQKKVVNFSEEKVHPGDLAGGSSGLEMTWLLYCAGAATESRLGCYSVSTSVTQVRLWLGGLYR